MYNIISWEKIKLDIVLLRRGQLGTTIRTTSESEVVQACVRLSPDDSELSLIAVMKTVLHGLMLWEKIIIGHKSV